jgi:hypothetical protein
MASGMSTMVMALPQDLGRNSKPRSCKNSHTSRRCWGDFSIDTNYYDVFPDTGVTRDIFLTIEEGPCSPDGVATTCQTFNGTVPGPLIMVRQPRNPVDWSSR